MKIAFYTPFVPASHPNPSGARTQARDVISALERQGHQVRVVSEFRTKQFWLRKSRLRKLPPALLSAYRTTRNFRPDAWLTLVSQRKAPDLFGPLLTSLFRVPYVIYKAPFTAGAKSLREKEGSVRHLWLALPGHLLNRVALLVADYVIVNKLRDYEGHRGDPRINGKLSLLPPGISLQAFAPDAAERGRMRRELGIPDDACAILSVSRLSDEANRKAPSVRFLIDCAADLHTGGRNVRLLVVGDGKTRAELEAHAEGMGRAAIFAGRVEHGQVRSYYNAADVFAFPGLDEHIGMVYLEAQAAGLPVVAFANGGIPEVVRDGETGFLVEPLNRAEFVRRLGQLVGDRGLRQTMGRAAREHVESRHEFDEWGERLLGFLQRTAGDPR